MRVLVTGGAGFIGSHIIDELVSLGHEVINVDVMSADAHKKGAWPGYLNPEADHRFVDVRNLPEMLRAVEDVDAVCHQAGRVGLGVDFNDVASYVSHNDVGMSSLLEAMWRTKFEGRLVLASSMVVYGEGKYSCEQHGTVAPGPRVVTDLEQRKFEPPCPKCGMSLAWRLISEEAALDPRNVYAATKLHQEHLTFAYSREAKVPVTALRYHNVYGPRMPRNTPYAGVASMFRSALATGKPPRVYEDGGQMRDFVHVRDVAHANVLALTNDEPSVGSFNVCSGQPTSIFEMAATLCKHTPGASDQPIVTGEYRLGDVRHIVALGHKARTQLGYIANISFDEGMAEFAQAELRNSL